MVPDDPLKKVRLKFKYRRRSWFGRLWHGHRRLVFLAVGLISGLLAATYLFLRVTGQLPGQILMRQSAAAMEQLSATPEFDLYVVDPLRQHLTADLAIGSRLDDLVEFMAKSGAKPVPGTRIYRRAQSSPSMLIGAWRDIIQDLRDRRVEVYALHGELAERDRWLRGYVLFRLLRIDAFAHDRAESEIMQRRLRQRQDQTAAGGTTAAATETFARQARADAKEIERLRQQVYAGNDPMLFAQYGEALDVAQRALARRFGVPRDEFNAILYLANCAAGIRQQAAAKRK
jgi:hypothetical protein